jgi:hypothetical protein
MVQGPPTPSGTPIIIDETLCQDHIKSKKHMKAVELKKERYPDIVKRMEETRPPDQEEIDRPNNGDRLQYRWARTVH